MGEVLEAMVAYHTILDSDHYQQIIIRGRELQLIDRINSLITNNYINDNNIPQLNV
jgi:hypothetical protein